MSGLVEKLPSVVSGYWTIACVLIAFAIGWYILMLAKDGWEMKSPAMVMKSATGWVITVVIATIVLLPLGGWMFGEVFSFVFDNQILKTVERTASETARFTVDLVDGDGTITLPSIPNPKGNEPDVVVVQGGNSQPNTAPAPTSAPSGDDDAYQEYLRRYYESNGAAQQPSNGSDEPLGGVSTEQQAGPPPTPSAPQIASGGTYTVGRGDTLYRIAQAKLGDGEKWTVLCSLNFSGNKRQCDNLTVGQTIKLP